MTIPGFLKKKRTYILLIFVVLTALWFASRGKGKADDKYETAVVERSSLVRTVDVTGEIKPAQRIALSFEGGGTLAQVPVTVGKQVKAGDILAELEDADLSFSARRAKASLDAALANLNLRIAGETTQSIRVSEADVEKAQAAYDKTVIDLQNTKITTNNDVKNAELALSTAQLNANNEGATNEQSIADAYADLRLALLTALGPMQTAMTDGDKLIGVDDTASNSTYRNVLSIGDSTALTNAQTHYKIAKPVKALADQQVRALSAASSQVEIEQAATTTQQALSLLQTYLSDVQKVLAATIPSSALTESDLTTKKAQIDADRSAISTQKASVENGAQAAVNAKLGRTTSQDKLENARQTAELNLEIAKAEAETQLKTAEANLAINQAGLSSAQAALDLKKSGPRAVDLAPLRAAVAEAEVAHEQAENALGNIRITAPVDGVITEIIPELGEQVTPNTPAVRMIGFSDYDIEILLPEADVVKVKVGQTATITLDAYGDNVVFTGIVVSEEPDQTLVQDAVYYKARIQIAAPSEGEIEFKPGMTANVTILTAKAEQTLTIPARAVRTNQDTGEQTLRVLEGDQPVERKIKTGLRGDEGRIEILEGLKEGEIVIVSEKTP